MSIEKKLVEKIKSEKKTFYYIEMDNTFWVRSLAYPVDNDGAGEGRGEDTGYGAHSVRDPHKDGGIVGRYIKVVHAKTRI